MDPLHARGASGRAGGGTAEFAARRRSVEPVSDGGAGQRAGANTVSTGAGTNRASPGRFVPPAANARLGAAAQSIGASWTRRGTGWLADRPGVRAL